MSPASSSPVSAIEANETPSIARLEAIPLHKSPAQRIRRIDVVVPQEIPPSHIAVTTDFCALPEALMSTSAPSPDSNSGSQPAPKKPTSAKKIAANRLNGQKTKGPKNTTSTRFNATKHGLLADGVTELDDAEGYRITLRNMIENKDPVGPMEEFLVKSAAVDMVRWLRARRLEAEYITSVLHPEILGLELLGNFEEAFEPEVLDPELPAIDCESAQSLVSIFQRYESAIAMRLFRTLHELERLQRIRRGERLPAPVAVDVNVHADVRALDSFAESAAENDVEGSPAKPDDKQGEIDESPPNGEDL